MGEFLVLIAVFVLVFSVRRLPELLGAVWSSKDAFKKGLEEGEERKTRDVKEIRSLEDTSKK
jgi:Sec-independent protein translocase protein TatA